MSVKTTAEPKAEEAAQVAVAPAPAVAPAEAPEAATPSAPIDRPAQVPTPVLVVAYARVVPFVACAFIVALTSSSPSAANAFVAEIAYGAVLLSFLGGARWGAAMTRGGEVLAFKPLALTMLPTFLSWCVLFMAQPTALAALMAGFLLVALAERAGERADLAPRWRKGLDLPLTVLTELALGVSLFCAITA